MDRKPKVVFLGSSEFAVPALERLNRIADLRGVFVQPDKKRGRGNKVTFLPVKERALDLGLDVYQPENVSSTESEELIRSLDPDLLIVCSYGQILKQNILDIPKYGALNIHGSILPKYRGAAPIQRTLLNNEEKTGNTIMKMDAGLDTGDTLAHSEFIIPEDITADILFRILSMDGANLLEHVLDDYLEGNILAMAQDDKKATYAEKIRKEEAHIDWNRPAILVSKQINAMDSNPGAYSILNNQKLKLFSPSLYFDNSSLPPGTILEASTEDDLIVKCSDGALKIQEIQKPGKRRMAIRDYLRGNTLEIGQILE